MFNQYISTNLVPAPTKLEAGLQDQEERVRVGGPGFDIARQMPSMETPFICVCVCVCELAYVCYPPFRPSPLKTRK